MITRYLIFEGIFEGLDGLCDFSPRVGLRGVWRQVEMLIRIPGCRALVEQTGQRRDAGNSGNTLDSPECGCDLDKRVRQLHRFDVTVIRVVRQQSASGFYPAGGYFMNLLRVITQFSQLELRGARDFLDLMCNLLALFQDVAFIHQVFGDSPIGSRRVID